MGVVVTVAVRGVGLVGGKTTDVDSTDNELTGTPSSLERVLVTVVELSVVLSTPSASEGVPSTAKDIVAVVSVVMGVATVTAAFNTLERLEVRALVRLAVAFASISRLSLPDGISTMMNVTTKFCSDRRRPDDVATSTLHPVSPAQKLLSTESR
jgi:hypothetical protein